MRPNMTTKPYRRRSLVSIGLGAACGSTLLCTSAFCPPHAGRFGIIGISTFYWRSDVAPLKSAVLNHTSSSSSSSSSVASSSEESNFWFTVTHKEDDDSTNEKIRNGKWPPVVPSLDAEGSLPHGCYKIIGREECQPKPTCAIGIAVDDLKRSSSSTNNKYDDLIGADEIVQGMQHFVDHGFTTFHLPSNNPPPIATATTTKRRRRRRTIGMMGTSEAENNDLWLPSSSYQVWGEAEIYGRLQKSTPASVMRTCHLVVPITTPPSDCHVSRLLVRQAVAQSLERIGTNSIDTLEVQYCHNSPNCFDMMDYLIDLQREGLVRSIAGFDFPTTTMRSLEEFGFHLDYHKRGFNLLSSSDDYTTSSSIPNIISMPLGGGLLTDKFEGRVFPPLSSEVGDTRSKQFLQTLQSWAGRTRRRQRQQKGGDGDEDDVPPVHYLQAWKQYQNVLLPQLREIARNYRVSIASVALRWILQMEQTGGTIVGCDFSTTAAAANPNHLPGRITSLRDTFRFELDEEDMELIREASGTLPLTAGGSSSHDGQHENIDLNNPKLWL